MNTRQILVTAMFSTLFTILVFAGIILFIDQAAAAPSKNVKLDVSSQATGSGVSYISSSGIGFLPVQQNSTFIKDNQRQLLFLTGQDRNFSTSRNVFVAPLELPDRSELLSLTVFGEDFDTQGEVRVRLKRCDQNQARCAVLADTTSTVQYAGGLFETNRTAIFNEVVNNGLYTYFYELELTALLNSGLRSARLELVLPGGSPPDTSAQRWELSGSVLSFPLPNTSPTEVQICTDDLSHLNNATHYPFVAIDGAFIPLTSNTCITVLGRDIEIRRRPNTGPSSGTYQFLR